MIAAWLMNRGSGCGVIAPRLMMAVAMGWVDAIDSVVMAVVVPMTGKMETGEMDMRPTRMPRSIGMHVLRKRDRNSAE